MNAWLGRLPFFYGWVVIGIAFITVSLSVNARTMFSLLFPPILAEMEWDRSTTAAGQDGVYVEAAAEMAMDDAYEAEEAMPIHIAGFRDE